MIAVASIAEVLIYKILKRHNEEGWVNWAYEMLVAGYETESLLILAGMRGNLEYFEMWTLTDKVLKELEIDYADQNVVITGYVSYVAHRVLSGEEKPSIALRTLKDIYFDLDYEPLLSEFFNLYYAWEDLQSSEDQWYVNGVDRSNIDEAITSCFKQWLKV
ncbi:hypothetical protein [Pedobacter frigoris]|uniref:hypothetical protein n=1 Tax=Pedobacter frigoris TaxID=2571272 RepID=UPI0029310AC0|nr:hypothetical protein [Pedobacter frigoris]